MLLILKNNVNYEKIKFFIKKNRPQVHKVKADRMRRNCSWRFKYLKSQ